MAALASARRGDLALDWRDWTIGLVATWILPIPVGLIMLIIPLGYMSALHTLGATIPGETTANLVFALGWVVTFSPLLSWIGIGLSAPLVWLALRTGRGGWLNFVIGGAAVGMLTAGLVDGINALFPAVLGMISGAFFRLVLSWRRPEIITQE